MHHGPFPGCFQAAWGGKGNWVCDLDEAMEEKCSVCGDPGVLCPRTVEKEETEEKEGV